MDVFGFGASIRTCQKIQCLPYAVFSCAAFVIFQSLSRNVLQLSVNVSVCAITKKMRPGGLETYDQNNNNLVFYFLPFFVRFGIDAIICTRQEI